MSEWILFFIALIVAIIVVSIVVKLLKGVLKIVLIVVVAVIIFTFLAGISLDWMGEEENQTYVNKTANQQGEFEPTNSITGMVTKITDKDWWKQNAKEKLNDKITTSKEALLD